MIDDDAERPQPARLGFTAPARSGTRSLTMDRDRQVVPSPVFEVLMSRVIQWDEGRSRIYQLRDTIRENLEPPLTVGRLLRANKNVAR